MNSNSTIFEFGQDQIRRISTTESIEFWWILTKYAEFVNPGVDYLSDLCIVQLPKHVSSEK
jgi:hypothetical protein